MKKYFSILIVLVCFVSASLFALDDFLNSESILSDIKINSSAEREFLSLNDNQRDEFLKNSLYVETLSSKSKILFSSLSLYSPYMHMFSYSPDYNDLDSEWRAYLGYNEISKYEFFDLVGREDLKQKWIDVQNARSHRYKVFMGVGGAIIALGGLLGITGAILQATSINQSDVSLLPLFLPFFYAPSIALVISGVITMACWEINAPSFPNLSIRLALNLSNQYNQNLINRIKGQM